MLNLFVPDLYRKFGNNNTKQKLTLALIPGRDGRWEMGVGRWEMGEVRTVVRILRRS